uniref:Uncharacterized protein n=1 Tax=Lactuca sativa TaxID=4236 RepID=A0A9R1V7K8_LACSA|nr:hypothetical protein LSAT_V11C600316180 [Lactuca sativa]
MNVYLDLEDLGNTTSELDVYKSNDHSLYDPSMYSTSCLIEFINTTWLILLIDASSSRHLLRLFTKRGLLFLEVVPPLLSSTPPLQLTCYLSSKDHNYHLS